MITPRLWPRSLGGRLVLLLVAALAAAQLALVFVLRGEQDSVVEAMVHGQALTQTVTFARLLSLYPPEDGPKLANAFGSRQSCARISNTKPPERSMTATERHLADLLVVMLHNVQAGAPTVAIEPFGTRGHPCDDGSPPHGAQPPPQPGAEAAPFSGAGPTAPHPPGPPPNGPPPDGPPPNGPPPNGPPPRPGFLAGPPLAVVAMAVPLADGRTLTMRTAIGVPSGWNPAAILSFLLSSLAVASVAIVSVRLQTRALRALADASDRFGRGETVPPLRTAAPAEVAAAIGAFNTMQARLNLFLRDRIRLLAGISHDLRTPLTTLRLKAEFIDDEAVRDDLVRTIDELTVICEATLAFTRAEATTEPTTTVDLADLVEQVSEAFRLAGGDVTVARIPPIGVACRPVALKRAVRNLVENALRYGERARISASQDPDAGVTITVEDDGPGLRPDQIEDAFLPFVRLEPSRSTETGGIGLGLAIARSIVKAHGGTLTLANLPAGGLRAEIRLPPGPEIRPATA